MPLLIHGILKTSRETDHPLPLKSALPRTCDFMHRPDWLQCRLSMSTRKSPYDYNVEIIYDSCAPILNRTANIASLNVDCQDVSFWVNPVQGSATKAIITF